MQLNGFFRPKHCTKIDSNTDNIAYAASVCARAPLTCASKYASIIAEQAGDILQINTRAFVTFLCLATI